jgi:carnitine O-palmitoyltransferase 1, liver isoform
MPVIINGKLLTVHEIQYQLDYIVRSSTETTHAEKYLASLTASNRTKWAEIRNQYFSSGVNKISLECIESSTFFLNLHDGPYEMDLDSPEEMKIYSKQCLHGNGFDIWFDKSYCISAGTNAR